MRILGVHNRYRSAAPSGENRVVDQEAAALRAAGHEVELFERHSDEIDGWSTARKASLPLRVVRNPASRRDLTTTLRSYRPDVVHLHNTFPLLSPSVLHACRDEKVPVVATLHNYKLLCASGDFFRAGSVCHDCASGSVGPALRHGCYRGSTAATVPVAIGTVANRRAWRSLVSAYVFISAAQRRLLAGLRLDEARVFVKHNLVPLADGADVPDDALAAASADPAGPGQVAYVGRLDPAKGVPLLMAAWDRYRALAGDSGLRLVIAGSGPLEAEVRAWAASRPSVEVAGLLPPAECRALLARSRAVLMPSQWEETFGLVVVEAMAAGVPPIVAGHGSFPELVTAERDGVVFAAGDPDDLARAVRRAELEPAAFAGFGRAARETYRTRFDLAANVEQLVGIYRYAVRNPVTGDQRVPVLAGTGGEPADATT